MDSNLPRLQLELYKEIKKVIICVCNNDFPYNIIILTYFYPWFGLCEEVTRVIPVRCDVLVCLCRTVPLEV